MNKSCQKNNRKNIKDFEIYLIIPFCSSKNYAMLFILKTPSGTN